MGTTGTDASALGGTQRIRASVFDFTADPSGPVVQHDVLGRMTDHDRRVWEGVLAHLRTEHPAVCRRWFEDLEPLGVHEGAFGVRVHSAPHRDYLRRNCLEAFNDALRARLQQLIPVRFIGPEDAWVVTPQSPARGAKPSPAADNHTPAPQAQHRMSEREHLEKPGALTINPDYAFENFIVGPNNQFSHASATAVVDNPGRLYNPLFIHGGVGLGKTHLLQAICLSLCEKHPSLKFEYLSCDAFMNRFMAAVQSGELLSFRESFQDLDLLVIDDIHLLAQRDRTQEEFFHTFNALFQANKQIVLSSDAPPSEIPKLEERLVSRFKSGVVTEVVKPSFETRVEIVKHKGRMLNTPIPDEVAAEIAECIDANIRELEGAIYKLQMVASVKSRMIDLGLAREVLPDLITAGPEVVPTIDRIITEVTEYYQVKRTEVLGKRKHRSIALPRQVGMYLARERTSHSLEEIAAHFGGRDHTTVMYAQKKITDERTKSPEIERAVVTITNRLRRPPGPAQPVS